MAHYQIILAYDGTQYRGSQRQLDGSKMPTVQGSCEEALRKLGWRGRSVLTAGRTDSGVHASGQVFSFDLDWDRPPNKLREAINGLLPKDIAVQEVRLVRPEFHPRYDAIARRYRYHIFCQRSRDPLRERFAWRVWPCVDIKNMQQASRILSGTHDFASFGTPSKRGGSTVREVMEANWSESRPPIDDPPQWIFDILAEGFLYRMVRRLVYLLVSIGQGKLEPEIMRKLLENPESHPIQGLAPPHGLQLVEVLYPPDVFLYV
jgi:tRNA pseudouridine38-40 synthase